ncbi:hypothetical protein TRFO_21090 [Tritrichomonas foetus]|uniref:Importin N-terminal domain-containing protein n=1 Tax=Tritrichomonas foetus TaxID=1144522 RepID=A0A1J4KEF5_9EUKA|nr:hypothetical protein TRFO_21090 [Tritrichomonas foetus]|eukprot:OHT09823.1 hypothetical protein TRFO_21090 [Tritrichomonas foetus]
MIRINFLEKLNLSYIFCVNWEFSFVEILDFCLMRDLNPVFANLLSPFNDIRAQAETTLKDLILNNPQAYTLFLDFYSAVNNFSFKKLALILVQKIALWKFTFVTENLSDFLQRLDKITLETDDVYLQKNIVHIFYIIMKLGGEKVPQIQETIRQYILLYQTDQKYLTISFELMKIYLQNQASMHLQAIDPNLVSQLTYFGLISPVFILQIESVAVVSLLSKFPDFEKFQVHLDKILEMAQNSIQLDNQGFINFWTALIKISSSFSLPFCEIAKHFIGENLEPDSKDILLTFLFKNLVHFKEEDYPALIQQYFEIHSSILEPDYTPVVINHALCYIKMISIIKVFISQYIQLPNLRCRLTALIATNSLLYSFNGYINDADFYVNVAISQQNPNQDFTGVILSIISSIFTECHLQFQHTDLLVDYLMAIYNSNDHNIRGDVFETLATGFIGMAACFSHKYIDRFISMRSLISYETIPRYLSLLFSCISIKIDIHHPKYNELHSILADYLQIANTGANSQNEDHIYICTRIKQRVYLLYILLFYYRPLEYADVISQAMEESVRTMNIISNTYNQNPSMEHFHGLLCDLTRDFTDFSNLIFSSNGSLLEYLRPYYQHIPFNFVWNIFEYSEPFVRLMKTILKYDFANYPFSVNLMNFLLKEWAEKEDTQLADAVKKIRLLEKISSLIVYLQNQKFAQFYSHALGFTHKYSAHSMELFEMLVMSIFKIVKRKSILLNSQCEWYAQFVNICCSFTKFFIDEVVVKITPNTATSSFKAILYIYAIFMHRNNPAGHKYLQKIIFPLLDRCDNQEAPSFDYDVINIATMILKNDYITDIEIEFITTLVTKYINDETNDIKLTLIMLIYELVNKQPNQINAFLETFLTRWESTRNNVDEIVYREYMAILLLSIYNINREAYACILNLIPEILSLFPIHQELYPFKFFCIEMFKFIENVDLNIPNMKELLIAAFIRYLSYQNHAPFIFSIDIATHQQIIEITKRLLSQFNDIPAIIASIIPEQTTSIQYVLSILSS